MLDGPIAGRLNATDVEERLADAGRVLLALPWSGCFPAGYRALWPHQGGPSAGRRMPTAREISAMDEAYRWTSFIADQDERRLVLMRSLIFEDAEGRSRYVWTWRRLRRTTGLHSDTLKARWGRGIDRIVRGLNQSTHHRDSNRSDGFSPIFPGKPTHDGVRGLHPRALGGLTGRTRQNHAIRRV